MRQLDSVTNSMDMNLSKSWELVRGRGAWHATAHGVSESDNNDLATLQQQQHKAVSITDCGQRTSMSTEKTISHKRSSSSS